MKRPVIVRFQVATETVSGARYEEGQHIELPSIAVADILYGDAVEIISYADGEPYEPPTSPARAKIKKGVRDALQEPEAAEIHVGKTSRYRPQVDERSQTAR